MTGGPLVSILIPAYNKEKWLVETLESALAQTWADKEIIVVDDGSTDGTGAILRTFESRGVKVVSQENQGACAARNRAYSLAQGRFIQWLDADDLLHPRKIECQFSDSPQNRDPLYLKTAAFGSFYFQPERARFQPNGLWQDLTPADWMVVSFKEKAWLNPTSWLVSRELSELGGPWNSKLALSGADDGEYLCRLISRSKGVKFFSDALCYYRIGNLESLNHNSAHALDSLGLALVMSIQHLLSVEDSPRARQAGLQYLQDWYHFFYGSQSKAVAELQEFAAFLGGALAEPSFSWKYEWIRALFGWKAADAASNYLRSRRMLFARAVERRLPRRMA